MHFVLKFPTSMRLSDPTTAALYAILDEARADHELASIVHAAADDRSSEDATDALVAASGAVDTALHALTSYVVHGVVYGSVCVAVSPNPLHERCRLARNAIEHKVAEVFAARFARTSA